MNQIVEMRDKETLIGSIFDFLIVTVLVLSFLGAIIENIYIKKHGVWTIFSVIKKTSSTWKDEIYYQFYFNDHTFLYNDRVLPSTFKKTTIGNRFFVNLLPNKEKKQRKYISVPEWFTLDAPNEGWKALPTENELREMMRQHDQKNIEDNNDIFCNMIDNDNIIIINDSDGNISLFLILFFLSYLFFFILLDFLEKKQIEKHGIWTIASVTHKTVTALNDKIHYQFISNNQLFRFRKRELTKESEKIKPGDRFFLMVIPNKEKKYRLYDAVPEWFTLDIPSQVEWKKCPTEQELREMILLNEKSQI